MATRTVLRRALRAAALAHRGASFAPAAARLTALDALATPSWQPLACEGGLRGFASRPRSARDAARAAQALRRKRETAEGGAPDADAPHVTGVPDDVARAAAAAGGAHALEPHAASAVAFTQTALAPVLGRSALVVTREIEWGTLILGFEQANKYTIRDANGEVVAFLAEETASLASAVGRQLLRRRRPVTATVLNPAGEVIFRVRRPMYLINSRMTVEDGSGAVVGEVLQRWHLWQRNYDLYLGQRQFARVRGRLLAWEFNLEDESGKHLARIDRNFQGFGKEFFTDAGMYVLHFGDAPPAQEGLTRAHAPPPAPPPPGEPGVVPIGGHDTWQPPVPVRPLALTERAVCLALAVAVDFDYFSQHSSGPGMLPLGMGVPIPVPMGGGSGEAADAAASEADAEAEGDDGGGDAAAQPAAPDWRDREQLGGDEPFKVDDEAATWSDRTPPPTEEEEEEDGDDEGRGGGSFFGLIGSVFGKDDEEEEE